MSKIIRNFIIENNDLKENDDDSLSKSHEHIIKVPIIEKNEKEISPRNLNPVLEEEPKLHLMKNSEGVVVGIEVHCICGQKILIRLDYKV